MSNKSELRKKFLELRNNIPKNEIENKSSVISDKLFSSLFYSNASSVFTYVNIGSEVQTARIIEKSLSDGKKVFIPKIHHDSMYMGFFQFESFDDLVKGRFGLLEPLDSLVEAYPDSNSIVLVPGLVFDYKKFRVGYGKGYYDYYFNKNICPNKIGLAFDSQIVDNLEHEYYDVPIDCIITEKNLIY